MHSRITFSLVAKISLCLLLLLNVASNTKAQSKASLIIILDGKPLDLGQMHQVSDLNGAIDFEVKGKKLQQITMTLVRGFRPIRVKTINGPEDYKDFQVNTWLKGDPEKAKGDGWYTYAPAMPGDRIVLEYSYDGGGGAVNLHIQ